MSTQENLNFEELNSLLDGTLDDLADLPEWKPFPAGAHKGKIVSWSQKAFEDKKLPGKTNIAMILKIQALETVEPADPTDLANPGQEVEFSYFLKHHSSEKAVEIGQGGFKKVMAALADYYKSNVPRELMEKYTGAEILVI